MNKVLLGIVLTLGAGAAFVLAHGWPVEVRERVKTEKLVIEYHHATKPSCVPPDDLITKRMTVRDIAEQIGGI